MAEQTRELPSTSSHGLNKFFGVVGEGRTYKNLAYLLLSFPLGILYFVAIVTGFSTGMGLLITVLGIFVLIGTALMVYAFSAVERYLAKALVGVDVTTPARKPRPEGFWNYLKATFGDAAMWKGLVHHMLRFPMGIVAFVVVVTIFSVSAGFISVPVVNALADEPAIVYRWTLGPAGLFGVSMLGVLMLFVSMHVSNGMAVAYAHLTRVMLGGGTGEAAPSEPVRDPLDQPAKSSEPEAAEAAPQV